MSAPHTHRSPSATRYSEIDFSSPAVAQNHFSRARDSMISPQLALFVDDVVSDPQTIRPHQQPLPALTSTGSSFHSTSVLTPPNIRSETDQTARPGLFQVKSFPHSADLLGNPSEASGSRASSRRASPGIVPAHEDTVLVPESPLGHRGSGGYMRELRRGADDLVASTEELGQAPEGSVTEGSRINSTVDLPHFRDFEARTTGQGSGVNELGVFTSGRHPHPVGWNPLYRTIPPVDSARTGRTIARPISIGAAPARASDWQAPDRDTLFDTRPVSFLGRMTEGSATSTAPQIPTVPPPRSSLATRDAIEFSPNRLGRVGNDDSPSSSTAYRSAFLDTRLNRLDALRSQAEHLAPRSPTRPWETSEVNTSALDVSVRQGRISLDDTRDFRSRIRWRQQPDMEDVHADAGSAVSADHINRWNRHVQEAMGRRVSAERPQSPTSATASRQRLREDSAPYARPRITGRREDGSLDSVPSFNPYRQPRSGAPFWGEIPAHSAFGTASDGINERTPLSGWREPTGVSELLGEPAVDWVIGAGEWAGPAVAPRQPSPPGMPDFGDDYAMLDDTIVSEDIHMGSGEVHLGEAAIPAHLSIHHRHLQATGRTAQIPGLLPLGRPRGHPSLDLVKITPDMDQEAKIALVKSVARGVGRWPPSFRKRAAGLAVKRTAYSQLQAQCGVEKDEYCSICHDEVS